MNLLAARLLCLVLLLMVIWLNCSILSVWLVVKYVCFDVRIRRIWNPISINILYFHNLSDKTMWIIMDRSGTNQLFSGRCGTDCRRGNCNLQLSLSVCWFGLPCPFGFQATLLGPLLFWSKGMSHLTTEGLDRSDFREQIQCLLLNFSPFNKCKSPGSSWIYPNKYLLLVFTCNDQWAILMVAFRRIHFDHIWKGIIS